MKIYNHLIISLIILLLAISIGFPIIAYHFGYLEGYLSGVDSNCGGTITLNEPREERGGESTVSDIEPIPVLVNTTETTNPSKEEVETLVKYYITLYKTDDYAQEIMDTLDCESKFRHWDNNGNLLLGQAQEIGIAQFKRTTFDYYKNYYGLKDLKVENWNDQIRITVLMWGTKKWNHWTCSPL